jgi:uncharacterized repeat protein (TIGR03803 family)
MSMSRLSTIAALAILNALAVPGAGAQTLTTLHSFVQSGDGYLPRGGLTPLGGMLYGTTYMGGAHHIGTIYSVDPATGAETVLHDFIDTAPDGASPEGELAAANGVLYGTTTGGGAPGYSGTVYMFDPATRTETILYSFRVDGDANTPNAGVIYVDGLLFGTTSRGGTANLGTVFVLDPATGRESILHSFTGGEDGYQPVAPLTFADGFLYGTTPYGGPSNAGVVFRLDPRTGEETVLHAFTGTNAIGPSAGVTIADGMLYGTTFSGGPHRCGGEGCGTVFRVDAATGAETDLVVFTSSVDGQGPVGGLVVDRGVVYGTTSAGGAAGRGTVFAVDAATGSWRTIHDFEGSTSGQYPGTLLGFRRALYGTTQTGGDAGSGTVFELER